MSLPGRLAAVFCAMTLTAACHRANPLFQGASQDPQQGDGSPDAAASPQDVRPATATPVDAIAPSDGPEQPRANDAPAVPPPLDVAPAIDHPAPGPVVDGPIANAAVDAPAPGPDAGAACSGAPCPTLSIAAQVAECLHLGMPNLRACDTISPGALMVDLESTYTNNAPLGVVLRFVAPAALAGRTITAVRLRMQTETGPEGESGSTGELWQVAPFVAADLATVIPAKVGSAPLGADRGFIKRATVLEWPLPVTLVRPDDAVHLAILPRSTDRLYYENMGTGAPTLLVESK